MRCALGGSQKHNDNGLNKCLIKKMEKAYYSNYFSKYYLSTRFITITSSCLGLNINQRMKLVLWFEHLTSPNNFFFVRRRKKEKEEEIQCPFSSHAR